MNINSDVNILGSITDFNLISVFLKENTKSLHSNIEQPSYTSIKTIKSIKRFERAINNSIIKFKNIEIELLFRNVLEQEVDSINAYLMVFWNASVNNELLNYINQSVYFPALYSGRVTIKKDEVLACLKELKLTEEALQKWSDSTIDVTARKYLAFLRNFKLMEGGRGNKTISNHNISDKAFIIFIYWLVAVDTNNNVLESKWLQYSLLEKETFVKRILQKKFMKYYNVNYSGDKLRIETTYSYEEIYDELN